MRNFIFYRGPSLLDGKPIVGVATIRKGKGFNRKTGNIVQTWIIRSDVDPANASRNGADSSICGTCPHRGQYRGGKRIKGTRTCYVMLVPVLSVYRTVQAGAYDDLSADLAAAAARLEGQTLRLGAYGDPAAIPHTVWQALMTRIAAHTGYTHQWRSFPEFADIVMASCDSSADRVAAKLLGFRTFRVASAEGWQQETREILCPASEQAGKKTTCGACRACGGNSSKARADVMIPAHGAGKGNVAG